MFFGMFKIILHLCLKFKTYRSYTKLFSLFTDNSEKGVISILFIEYSLNIFINDRNKEGSNWLLLIDISQHIQQLLIRQKIVSWKATSFLL